MEDIVLRVDGMTCDGCEGRIRGALGQLPGVQNVTASHERGEVQVACDSSRISRAEVRNAIELAGYQVVS